MRIPVPKCVTFPPAIHEARPQARNVRFSPKLANRTDGNSVPFADIEAQRTGGTEPSGTGLPGSIEEEDVYSERLLRHFRPCIRTLWPPHVEYPRHLEFLGQGLLAERPSRPSTGFDQGIEARKISLRVGNRWSYRSKLARVATFRQKVARSNKHLENSLRRSGRQVFDLAGIKWKPVPANKRIQQNDLGGAR